MDVDSGSACSNCEDAWNLYVFETAAVVGSNVDRHSVLLRCPSCSRLFDAYPEERAAPEPIDEETAAKLYPEAF